METIEEMLKEQIEKNKRVIAESQAILEYIAISIEETKKIKL